MSDEATRPSVAADQVIPDYGRAELPNAAKSGLICLLPLVLAAIEYFWCVIVAIGSWMFVVGDNEATNAQKFFLGAVAALPVAFGAWIGYLTFRNSSVHNLVFKVINSLGMIACCVWCFVIAFYVAR